MPENLFSQSTNSHALAPPTGLSASFMAAAAAALLAGLLVISRHNYLLFHVLAEFFAIAVGLALFLLLWNARHLIRQPALVFLGIAYLNIGVLDLLHTLSYKGLGVLAGPDAVNQATQLWIAARGMEALSLLFFTFLLNRRQLRSDLVMGLYLAVSALILAAIFAWPVFPDCFIAGSGLTTFKVAAEYAICLILAAAALFLFRQRDRFEKTAYRLVLAAIGLTILAELAFTLYTDVYGLSNQVGHFLKIASFFLIYLGLIRSGLIRPYAMLFQDLANEKEALARSEEKFSKVFHQAPVMMALSTFEEGRYLDVNQSFEQSLGYSKDQVAGWQSIELGILAAEDRQRILQAIRAGGEARDLEMMLYRPDQTAIDCLYSAVPVDVEGQMHLLSIASDITRLKQAESEREITIHLLSLLNRENDLQVLIQEVISMVFNWFGCEGAGIRLRQGDAFPFFESRGLPADFLSDKKLYCPLSLIGHSASAEGKTLIGADPGCMCARVLSGRLDPARPFFTENGAFWTNNLDAFLASRAAGDQPGADRIQCRQAGFASVAVVPLRHGQETLGLLQLNDTRKNRFSAQSIQLLERMAANLSVGLAHRRAVAELRESEARYRSMVDSLAEGVILQDASGRLRTWNRVADAVFNISEAHDRGRKPGVPDGEAVHEDGSPFPEAAHPSMHTLRTGEPCSDVVMGLLMADGGYRWININTRPVFKESGALPDEVIISFSDITGLRRAEREYANLFHSMQEAFALHEIVLDPSGRPVDYRFLAVNPAFERLTGLNAADLIGRRLLEVLPNTEAFWIETYGRVALTGEPVNFSNYNRELDGHFEVTAYRPVKHQFACVFRDISARIRAEKEREALEGQLQQAQKMEAVGTLAGGIAHDFNNILASILGYTELSREAAAAGSGLQENLDEVLVAGNRARHLVDQILAISRKEKQEKVPLDIVPLVREALKMLRAAIPSSIEMRENICREALVVAADPTQIHQVVVNLATNAKQAMPGQKGVLAVAVAAEYLDAGANERFPDLAPGPYARISVSDNGPGIAPAHLEKIFEPYFTTKKKGEGTGLGLSVVHGIIRGHKGDIRVSSRLGEGTTFQVYLPVSGREQAREPAEPEPQELPGGTEAILVVDDEAPVARMLAMHLQALGYTVSVQTESAAALKMFQSAPEKYDMVITDMTMPGMTGDQLAEAVKELRPDLPIVLCTGFSEALAAPGASSAQDIAELLMKPVDKVVLAHVVRKLLDAEPAAGSG